MTPEHQFLSESLHTSLTKFSKSSLFGVREAQRKTFDFACVLNRDFSRPLVSQVLWKHFTGIEKDLRTLLHDTTAKIKVYLFKDSISARAKIEEILNSYKSTNVNNSFLNGLKLVPIPGDFDADKEGQQNWMDEYIQKYISEDLLFNVVFGNFSKQDLLTFENHGGPSGLKYALLQEIAKSPLLHMPTFKKELGYSTSGTIREGLIMLSATGLIKSPKKNIQCFPTIKGRWLLDITKRLLFDFFYKKSWSVETSFIFACLDIKMPTFENGFLDELETFWHEPIYNMLSDAINSKQGFGRDLLDGIDIKEPKFYSTDFIQETKKIFTHTDYILEKIGFFTDSDALLFENDFK